MTDPTPTPEPLVDSAWWLDFLQRLWRQGYQTALPILQAIVTQGAGTIDPQALAVAILGAEAVTLFKFVVFQLASVAPSNDSRAWVRILDRVVPAFAGVFAGVALADVSDFLAVDWTQTAYLAVVAAVLAAVAAKVDPAS